MSSINQLPIVNFVQITQEGTHLSVIVKADINMRVNGTHEGFLSDQGQT